MPACWKHLDEQQRRDVAALIGSFYDESNTGCSKELWALPNIKKFLNLGYVKLDDLAKFRLAYLATRVMIMYLLTLISLIAQLMTLPRLRTTLSLSTNMMVLH